MKKALSAAVVFGLLFISCQSEENTEKPNESSEENVKKDEIDLARFQEMAVEPCNLLTEQMVVEHFKVTAEELENDSYSPKKDKISSYDICKYLWKKPNYDEIDKRNQEIIMSSMMESAKTGNTKGSIDAAMKMEKSKFFVGLTNIDTYDDQTKAQKRFELLHKIPEKKDMEKLNEEIDKQDSLSDQGKDMGKDIAGGIASNMKFEKVEGIGDMAYWDFMSDRLDILYGNLQIGIVIHVSEIHEENIEAGKKIATAVMGQF